MKNEIINLSKELCIDVIGFTDLNCENFIIDKYSLQEKLGYKCTFQVGNINDKILTGDKYSMYKSIIVIGLSYPKIDTEKIHLSSCSWGIDYHIVLKEKLEKIGEFLSSKGYIYKSFVDNNPLDERYLAYKAGLGFFGLNNLLINYKLGTYFFIGVLLTDLVCEYDTPVKKNCANCKKCINACPTGAINENGILNSNRCLSYLTQKKDVSEEESKYFNNCIYGCDICSKVCPYNENVSSNNFKPLGNEIINEEKFLSMTSEEYKDIYSKNSCSWKNKSILDRNINYYKINNKK